MQDQILAIPMIVGLVEVAKRLGLPDRLAPLGAILIGILVSYLMEWNDPRSGVLLGVVNGLSAAGLYSGAKTLATPQGHVEPPAELPEEEEN